MMSNGSLKLSVNLNHRISSTSGSSRVVNVKKQEEDEDGGDIICESDPGNRQNVVKSVDKTTAGSGRNPSESRPDLLNVNIPTRTKSQKRKRIQTNFNNSSLLNESALDARRKEKARLKRLERQKRTLGNNDHIQQVAAVLPQSVTPLPVLDAYDPDVICLIGDGTDTCVDSKRNLSYLDDKCSSLPSVSKVEPEVIELSSGDEEEECNNTDSSHVFPRRVVPRIHSGYNYGKRTRWTYSERERIDQEKMEKQHRIERQRMKKRTTFHDLEKIELTTTGRLLVNAGHGPEDPDVHVCSHLTHILQPHQLGGVRFMYDNIVESLSEFKKSSGFGCILAHSMGLGKTIQLIAFVEVFLRVTEAKKVLIIVPVNTIQNWMNEFDKWMPKYLETGASGRQFEVFLLGDAVKTFDHRLNLIDEWSRNGGVLLVGYELFRLLIRSTQPKKPSKVKNTAIHTKSLDIDEKVDDFDQGCTADGRLKKEANEIIRAALVDPGPDMVVCDEGHKIKNLNTDIAAALGAIQTKRRIVLTGYPLQNNLMEYYCMVDFVRPSFLGSKKTFSIQFERPIKNGQCIDSTARDVKIARQRIHVLNNMLKGFIQRRTHHLLKAVLPEAKEFVLLLRKSPLQHILYRNFVMYANAEISSGNSIVFNPLKAFAACSKRENGRKRRSLVKTMPTIQAIACFDVFGSVHLFLDSWIINSCISYPGPSFCSNGLNVNNVWDRNDPAGLPTDSKVLSSVLENAQNAAKAADPTRITHSDLWDGLIDSKCEESNRSSMKNRRNDRSKPKTIRGVLEDDFEMMEYDQELQYDWAEPAMSSYKKGNIEHGYKMVLAMELLDATVLKGEKMLIFSQNLTALDLIETYLSQRLLKTRAVATSWIKNLNYFRFDGSTSPSERERLINRFNSDRSVHLFLISTRAGSLGINLVAANRCIIFDACWNPCHDAQAVCRVYRYGQQRRTYIYRLIVNNCMEKAIFNRQISKHGLQQRVVDDAQVDANITQKELETLLMYDESLDVVTGKWDTSNWKFDDEVLESVVKNRSEMLAEEPFLHESLMLEREEGLSEEEKREAELWFAKEQFNDETSYPRPEQYSGGQSKIPDPNDVTRWMRPSYFSAVIDAPPLRSTPVPRMIDRNPEPSSSGRFGSSFGGNVSEANSGMNTADDQVSRKGRVDSINHIPARIASFPGAAVAYEPLFRNQGSVQHITTDRALCLPIVANPSESHELPANTQAMLVRIADGVFLRLSNGLLLDARNTVFDTRYMRPPPSNATPSDSPQRLQLPPPLKTTPDVIELD
ncbi:SNF2 N-terminal domain [Parelaphostrongylus tenuis]|uniref:SNF2 N-terminal domain n=1 Tax=Parelaphostrongylus tenuis TaxID=148309 RepID=A0AAD5QXU2_PARTN|nr:SNF2 N-terminal domain [Parelaphostrongylus tenuis]